MPTQSSKMLGSETPRLMPFLVQFQKGLLGQAASSIPLLTKLTQYYILQPSKRLRPCVIFLMCQATNGLGSEWHTMLLEAQASNLGTEEPLCSEILPSQIRLAQVVEMIHVASLLHDDVIDDAETRRGTPSAPAVFGNNRTILGGDFLLGRAMAMAASLRSPEVMALVAQAFCALVEGELLQSGDITDIGRREDILDTPAFQHLVRIPPGDTVLASLWEEYLCKTNMKTASLFATALQAAVLLGGVASHERWLKVATSYGKWLGMAFQIIDDLLDFEGNADKLGKPANADLSLGIATAPVLFALQEDDSIRPLVLRRFEQHGDVDNVVKCVARTQALVRTRELAELYAAKAQEALSILPESTAKDALSDLTVAILVRKN